MDLIVCVIARSTQEEIRRTVGSLDGGIKVMSYRNALDINKCELLEYFTDDEESEIIAIYIEGVRDGLRFYDHEIR